MCLSRNDMTQKSDVVKTVTLMGKRFAFIRSSRIPKNMFGYCTDPSYGNRIIKIDKKLKGERELEVIIHEAIHSCIWAVSEQIVEEIGLDISRALWKMGYRNRPKVLTLNKKLPSSIILRKMKYLFEFSSDLSPKQYLLISKEDNIKKSIKIKEDLAEEKEIEFILRSLFIGCCIGLDEEDFIVRMSKDIGRMLWRIGYRRKKKISIQ